MRKSLFLFVALAGILIILPFPLVQGTAPSGHTRSYQASTARPITNAWDNSYETFTQHIVKRSDWAQDYTLAQAAPQVLAQVAEGELVSYKAFDGTTYLLRQYTGKYTAILMKPEDVEFYMLPRLRELLDQCDLLYTYYKEIIQAEPGGAGITSIAFVKNCGYGCGRLGSKGMEIDPSSLKPGNLAPYLVIVHEMAHNFDRYSSALMVGTDPPHAWTAFWELYMQLYSNGVFTPAPFFERFVNLTFDAYLSNPSATWETCVRDEGCLPITASNDIQAGILLRIVQMVGPAIITRWLERVRQSSRWLNGPELSPLERNDVLIDTLSQAASANLVCLFDLLRFPVSDQLRARLQRKFESSSLCEDKDNDGYTPITRDCDDGNSTIYPGGIEVENRLDDDCNRVIDDLLISENGDFPNTRTSALQLSIPRTVKGTISSVVDFDHFQVNVPQPLTIIFSPTAIGRFSGWIHYYRQNTDELETFSYLPEGLFYDQPMNLPTGPWNIAVTTVSPPNFGHNPVALGSYEIRIRKAPEEVGIFFVPPARVKHFNHYVLTAQPIPHTVSEHPRVRARFWVSTIGWIGEVEASPSSEVSFEWIAPAGTLPGTIWYRVQYYKDSLPLKDVSAPTLITVEHDPASGPTIDSVAFDGKKIVTISGVRFGTAPQVIINAVDRSKNIRVASESVITLSGKLKKLGLNSGDNTIQIYTSSGSASNVFTLRL